MASSELPCVNISGSWRPATPNLAARYTFTALREGQIYGLFGIRLARKSKPWHWQRNSSAFGAVAPPLLVFQPESNNNALPLADTINWTAALLGRTVIFVGDSLGEYQANNLLMLASDNRTHTLEAVRRSFLTGGGESIHQVSWCKAICPKVPPLMRSMPKGDATRDEIPFTPNEVQTSQVCQHVHSIVCWVSAGKSESGSMRQRTLGATAEWLLSSLNTLTPRDVIVANVGPHYKPWKDVTAEGGLGTVPAMIREYVEVMRWHASGKWRGENEGGSKVSNALSDEQRYAALVTSRKVIEYSYISPRVPVLNLSCSGLFKEIQYHTVLYGLIRNKPLPPSVIEYANSGRCGVRTSLAYWERLRRAALKRAESIGLYPLPAMPPLSWEPNSDYVRKAMDGWEAPGPHALLRESTPQFWQTVEQKSDGDGGVFPGRTGTSSKNHDCIKPWDYEKVQQDPSLLRDLLGPRAYSAYNAKLCELVQSSPVSVLRLWLPSAVLGARESFVKGDCTHSLIAGSTLAFSNQLLLHEVWRREKHRQHEEASTSRIATWLQVRSLFVHANQRDGNRHDQCGRLGKSRQGYVTSLNACIADPFGEDTSRPRRRRQGAGGR